MEQAIREIKLIKPTKGRGDTDKIRVAAYCRVSSDGDDQLNSFYAQMKYYMLLPFRHTDTALKIGNMSLCQRRRRLSGPYPELLIGNFDLLESVREKPLQMTFDTEPIDYEKILKESIRK